jgi:rhamnosyltransferase
MNERPVASVVLLTFNGEEYLPELMRALSSQETDFPYEIIVIDSGSSDQSVAIVQGYNVRLLEIPNREFNHGATRNLGAGMARGDYVAYITQSALPFDSNWLQHLVNAFAIDERVAAVYGKHIPRPDCDPITARDISEFMKLHGPDDRPTVQRIEPGPEGREAYEANEGILGFYSDANSCLRKRVWEEVPYQPLNYAEDQAFGRDILEAGYWKVYEPRAAVYHSHSYAPWRYFRRQFDEYRGLRESIGYRQEGSIFLVVGGAAKAGFVDSKYIRRQSYPPSAKAKWITYAFVVGFLRRFAGYLAAREQRLPKRVVQAISLEAGARAKAADKRS